jgi:hypothetical protein
MIAKTVMGSPASPRSTLRSAVQLGEVEVAIGAVWYHHLARLEAELNAIEMHDHDIRLERHHVRDATDLGVSVRIRPSGLTRVADRVIAAEPLVRAECLEFHRREGGLFDVVAWHVPARREAGLVQRQRPLCVGMTRSPWRTARLREAWRISMR